MLVVIIASSPQAKRAIKQFVTISVSIVTEVKVYAVVRTIIGQVACGSAKVEVVAIVISIPDAHTPRASCHVYRAEEVVTFHELAVLIVAQHIHEVLIAHIEQVVVIVYGIVISIHHIVNHLVHLIEEVKVYLIHILILAVREPKLMPHAVGEEACFATDF